MSRSTFSILPYINRQKVKADGTANILCRITVDGKSAAISTGISCTPQEWNAKKGEVRNARDNGRLASFLAEVKDKYNSLLTANGIITVEMLKAVLKDGDKWLIYNRKKTGTLARVKLLPEALELMAKYEDEARDSLFPLLSTNRVRIDLITICKLAETSKTYSYHSGRHSFASLITLEAGVPMETICKMLGHKDVKMTQRYARVTQKKLFEDMDKFIAATEKDFVLAL